MNSFFFFVILKKNNFTIFHRVRLTVPKEFLSKPNLCWPNWSTDWGKRVKFLISFFDSVAIHISLFSFSQLEIVPIKASSLMEINKEIVKKYKTNKDIGWMNYYKRCWPQKNRKKESSVANFIANLHNLQLLHILNLVVEKMAKHQVSEHYIPTVPTKQSILWNMIKISP